MAEQKWNLNINLEDSTWELVSDITDITDKLEFITKTFKTRDLIWRTG